MNTYVQKLRKNDFFNFFICHFLEIWHPQSTLILSQKFDIFQEIFYLSVLRTYLRKYLKNVCKKIYIMFQTTTSEFKFSNIFNFQKGKKDCIGLRR